MTLTESKYESYHPTEEEFCQNRISTTQHALITPLLCILFADPEVRRGKLDFAWSQRREREKHQGRAALGSKNDANTTKSGVSYVEIPS